VAAKTSHPKTKRPPVTETPVTPIETFLNEIPDGTETVDRMSRSFDITQIDRQRGSITVELRQELIGPIADALMASRDNGRLRTRFMLGELLHLSRDILTGRVDADQVGFTGRVI